MRTLLPFLLVSTLLAGAPFAQTYISGPVTTDTIWNAAGSPYVIQADVDVIDGSTLTIQAGVTVAFDGDFMLSTAWNAAIVAAGAPGDRVLFTSNAGVPQTNDWKWVVVSGPNPSSLAHCTFEYAEQGFRAGNAEPTISHCVIRHCSTGIYCANASPTIEHSEVTACGTAIWIHGNASDPVINTNNIHDNSSWSVYVTGFPEPAVTIDAQNNWWGTTDGAEIALDIKDSNDDPDLYATIDFDPWLGAMSTVEMSWGGVKALYER
ncbi:right-handed parallel beta-helix repeat-containing protein [bacterium]|nr:right-handed parallel beta-helix repeat-containing protein [bacterium]MBU1072598.1 right-handed parallel beta-helix repeat-containing protein [bacterium]MBU1674966.1 right-handed parallel beta-helix repeat-containing protein [bacterium]